MTLKRMSIKVSEDLYDWIAEESKKRGLTMNAVIIFALETYYNQTTVLPNLSAIKELMEKVDQVESN